MMDLRSGCSVVLAIALVGCGQQKKPPGASESRFEELDAMLAAQREALVLPGMSAALMVRGEVVWTGARGWADVEARTAMTPDTPFNIASLTKPMTAVMLMQLVERGELSLETPMQQFDPAYTDVRVTVGHVLSMTAQSDPPGEAYAYDGNVFGTLGAVLTSVTGETLPQAFSERLIEPLGLAHTAPGHIGDDAAGLDAERIAHYQSISARVAHPYNVYGGVEIVPAMPPDPTLDAAANVIATASDYARFADAVLRGRLVEAPTLEAMWTPAVTSSGERLPYAYGWFVEEYEGHRLIHHYGYYDSAYSALVLIVPEEEIVFVALANAGGLAGHNQIVGVEGNVVACAVLRELVDATLPCAEAAAGHVETWRSQFPPAPPEIAVDPATLPRYTGTFALPSGGTGDVVVEQDRLWWKSRAGAYQLTPIGPDRFVLKAASRVIDFVFEGDELVRVDVTLPGDPNTYALPRVP
jgi:CubicO group peptidase (beta-lactamase class C family)